MQMIPNWRPEPKLVWIKCQVIKDGSHPTELIVQFKVNGKEYMAFVPDHYVDREISGLQGLIVADYGDSWLIDLPTETLTSGSRIRVPDSEKAAVVMPVD